MSLAQGNPFVLTYRLHIIGPAQECSRVTCRVCLSHSCKSSRSDSQAVCPAAAEAQMWPTDDFTCRLQSRPADCHKQHPDHLHNLSLTF